jgi:hypothetical protein
MAELPQTLEAAIEQAKVAAQAALDDGFTRLQVELNFPELKPMPIAEQFLSLFEHLGSDFKLFFPDAGAAALARRDWGTKPFEVRGIGELKAEIQPTDKAFLLVAPSAVEANEVEKLVETAGDRPFVMLNPASKILAQLVWATQADNCAIAFSTRLKPAITSARSQGPHFFAAILPRGKFGWK